LDFTALSHIDMAGANALRNIIDEYCNIEVSIYITGCSGKYNIFNLKYIYKFIFV